MRASSTEVTTYLVYKNTNKGTAHSWVSFALTIICAFRTLFMANNLGGNLAELWETLSKQG
jgi:hypothetical protein